MGFRHFPSYIHSRHWAFSYSSMSEVHLFPGTETHHLQVDFHLMLPKMLLYSRRAIQMSACDSFIGSFQRAET